MRKYFKHFYQALGGLCLGLCLAQASFAESPPFARGLLWKIETAGLSPSYVFGTIHSEDPRVLDLPQAVQECLDAARSLTLEAELDAASMSAFSESLFLPTEQDLQSLLGEADFRRAREALAARGLPPDSVPRLKPWAAMLLLSTPQPKTGEFLDWVLMQRAEAQDKPVYGLETLAEQGRILESFPRDEQIALLRATLDQSPEHPEMFEKLHGYYLRRDLAGMARFSEEYMRFGDTRLQARFAARLVDERNRRMVERMQPRLREGRAFIAVGALHLPGPQGILALLAGQGRTVTAVY